MRQLARKGHRVISPNVREFYYFRYLFTSSMSSSAASACPDVRFRFGSITWKRTWPSITSAMSPLMAPRQAAMVCSTFEHSWSPPNAFSIALIWPLILLTRFRSFSLCLAACAILFTLSMILSPNTVINCSCGRIPLNLNSPRGHFDALAERPRG